MRPDQAGTLEACQTVAPPAPVTRRAGKIYDMRAVASVHRRMAAGAVSHLETLLLARLYQVSDFLVYVSLTSNLVRCQDFTRNLDT